MVEISEQRLNKIEEKLDNLTDIVGKMAVQSQQIESLQENMGGLWKRMDKMYDNCAVIQQWQASCPRGEIKTIWSVVLSVAGTLGALFLYHVMGVKP